MHHSEMQFEHWRRMLAINLDDTYLPVMAVKDAMLAGATVASCVSRRLPGYAPGAARRFPELPARK